MACINLARSFNICSGHKNEFLKKNSVRTRRTLCQIPSLVSSHPDVDHTISKDQDAKVAPRCSKNRKLASRGLKASDALHLIRTSGMTLPVNSPCCTYCLKKLRQDFCGNSCSICASDTCITEPQSILSTATSQFPDENLWCDEEQAMETTAPKKQKLHSPSLSCLHQSDSTQGQSEERFFPSQSTEPVTITDESSQDFFSQNSTGSSYTQTYGVDVLNNYLEGMKLPRFSTEERKLWNKYVKSAKSAYCKRFAEIFHSIVSSVFPYSVEEILDSIMSKPEADGVFKTQSFGPLLQAYRDVETCRHRCQILSFLTQTMSYKEIVQILPEVTHSKFFTAKIHAKLVGPGLPITVPATRQKMDPVKLDNFLDFITSEHMVRDLPFGERKIRLSDGTVMEMPNVVHSMGASDVIHQYKSFCAENEITPLGESTMYRILSQCGAKVRTSLEGIDYFVAEGSRAFTTLADILDELVQIEVLNQQQSKDAASLLLQCKQYLRTDFKARIVCSLL